jgi:hypothetical protein
LQSIDRGLHTLFSGMRLFYTGRNFSSGLAKGDELGLQPLKKSALLSSALFPGPSLYFANVQSKEA